MKHLLCKIGIHDFQKQAPMAMFNPDWRWDNEVGACVTRATCSRCTKTINLDSEIYYLDYERFASDEEAHKTLEEWCKR